MKLNSITTASRNKFISHAILRRLAAYGIRIQPYYVFVEGAVHISSDSELQQFPEGYTIALLGESDMDEVSLIGDLRTAPEELQARLRDDQLCVGLKHHERIVSISWCNLRHFDFDGLKFVLRDNEAYLYGAETIPEYRGKGLAPFTRRAQYRLLYERGRTVCYSYSLALNKPALRFKEKVGAKVWMKCVFVKVGSSFSRNWILSVDGERPAGV